MFLIPKRKVRIIPYFEILVLSDFIFHLFNKFICHNRWLSTLFIFVMGVNPSIPKQTEPLPTDNEQQYLTIGVIFNGSGMIFNKSIGMRTGWTTFLHSLNNHYTTPIHHTETEFTFWTALIKIYTQMYPYIHIMNYILLHTPKSCLKIFKIVLGLLKNKTKKQKSKKLFAHVQYQYRSAARKTPLKRERAALCL